MAKQLSDRDSSSFLLTSAMSDSDDDLVPLSELFKALEDIKLCVVLVVVMFVPICMCRLLCLIFYVVLSAGWRQQGEEENHPEEDHQGEEEGWRQQGEDGARVRTGLPCTSPFLQ